MSKATAVFPVCLSPRVPDRVTRLFGQQSPGVAKMGIFWYDADEIPESFIARLTGQIDHISKQLRIK